MPNDVNEFDFGQRFINVVARVSDGAESRDIPFSMNTALTGDNLNVTGELWKVEKPDFVSVGSTIKRHRCASRTCSQYRDFH